MTVLYNWRDLAECRDLVTADDDPFFGESEDDERAAIAVCRLCPVQAECLTYAIRTGQEYGVWGGKSQRELRRLVALDRRGRVRVGQVPHGTPERGQGALQARPPVRSGQHLLRTGRVPPLPRLPARRLPRVVPPGQAAGRPEGG